MSRRVSDPDYPAFLTTVRLLVAARADAGPDQLHRLEAAAALIRDRSVPLDQVDATVKDVMGPGWSP